MSNIEETNTTTAPDDQREAKTNYFSSKIATKYTHSIYSTPAHNEWMSALILHALELKPGHVLVDIGCGPGLESLTLLKKMQNRIRVVGKYRTALACFYPCKKNNQIIDD